LSRANEIIGVEVGDNRLQVILEQRGTEWSEKWEPVYKGYAGRYTVDNLAPSTKYNFRLQYIDEKDGKKSSYSPEFCATTDDEPVYASNISRAIKLRDISLLKKLLEEKGAPINAMDKFGYTPLMQAVTSKHIDIVEILLEAKADIDFQNDTGKTALMMAAFSGLLSTVKILRQYKAKYNLHDYAGNTALHYACDSRSAELVDWMINDGAPTEAVDMNGYTPLLRVAALNGTRQLVAALIRHKANVNAADKKKKTALMMADVNGNAPDVQALLDSRADINVKNEYGKTVLEMAKAAEKMEVVEILEKYLRKKEED
jgi:ankyrin repeat protein